MKQTRFINVDFIEQEHREYILSDKYNPDFTVKKYIRISPEEAESLYFKTRNERRSCYVIIGGQRGDEAKGKATHLVMDTDKKVKWVMAPNSTHNAGKGITTEDINGNNVRVSLHLCPATLTDPDTNNFIGPNTQVNLFSLEREVENAIKATGRNKPGVNYHLTVDRKANLVIPVNRADDIVCKENVMGSTMTGATSSLRYVTTKNAPVLDDVLYDEDSFKSAVKLQIRDFNDFLKHDEKLKMLGILNIKDFGLALSSPEMLQKDDRLCSLASRLTDCEIKFFHSVAPEEFLLDCFKKILTKNLFRTGDVSGEVRELAEQGYSGILEGVQSVLLSGRLKYSKNRTAASTDGAGTIGDAALSSSELDYKKILVFKFGNTSVGGLTPTMAGMIRQDAFSTIKALSPKTGALTSFEKTITLEEFLSPSDISEAFFELNEAYFHALKNNYSLLNSRVKIRGIDHSFSLAEARALFTAYKWGETGETSKRARVCRFDNLVETQVVFDHEGHPMIVFNAADRAFDLDHIGVITAYKVVKPYRDYSPGDIIKPGMFLLKEEKTVDCCIPVITLLSSWKTIFEEDQKTLNKDLCRYLSLLSGGRKIIAIGTGPRTNDIVFIKEM
jgi:adenylosuccinate synthase